MEAVKEKATETIKMLSENCLKQFSEQWKIRMEKFWDSGEKYIEEDKVKVVREKNKNCYIKIPFFLTIHRIYLFSSSLCRKTVLGW